jgi:hypothetical protein
MEPMAALFQVHHLQLKEGPLVHYHSTFVMFSVFHSTKGIEVVNQFTLQIGSKQLLKFCSLRAVKLSLLRYEASTIFS